MRQDFDYETRPYIGGQQHGQLGPSGGYKHYSDDYILRSVAYVDQRDQELTLRARAFWSSKELTPPEAGRMAAEHFGWEVAA